MTQYVPTPTKWDSILYDGTNVNDVAAAVASAGGVLLVSPVNNTPYVFAGEAVPGAVECLGSLHATYMPWVFYVPDPYGNPIYPGEQRIVLRPWNALQDGPRGWSVV